MQLGDWSNVQLPFKEMYTQAGLLLAFSHGISQELSPVHHHLLSLPEDQVLFPSNSPQLGSLVQSSAVLEYDLGGEGDLFKAPEPIIGEPVDALGPMTTAMSLISDVDVITAETIKVADMESIQIEHLDDVIYECKKEFLAKCVIEETFSEPVVQIDEDSEKEKTRMVAEGQMQRSVSSGCLTSMEWINGCCNTRPNFLSFEGLDFGAAFGMRRAFSEGDIQTLGNNYTASGCTGTIGLYERQLSTNDLKSKERREKLSRYRRKKSKRNFNRKIKYACRKALADNQPRVRGRFAKTDGAVN
ncbi:hypothetical protein J5N97_019689 [Dioscorea zingiberensis]|uniref:CCT domain-containing protein n=1 Tax=Dioscorea zingiberensis TaxID=325984 RepID=A0A9D5HCY3_9LILI|nr:hypothetical protein J5N97_019689 [Dioscorea zingiberensis]